MSCLKICIGDELSRGPVVRGPVVRGQIGVLSIEGTVVTRHPSSDICSPTLSHLLNIWVVGLSEESFLG